MLGGACLDGLVGRGVVRGCGQLVVGGACANGRGPVGEGLVVRGARLEGRGGGVGEEGVGGVPGGTGRVEGFGAAAA